MSSDFLSNMVGSAFRILAERDATELLGHFGWADLYESAETANLSTKTSYQDSPFSGEYRSTYGGVRVNMKFPVDRKDEVREVLMAAPIEDLSFEKTYYVTTMYVDSLWGEALCEQWKYVGLGFELVVTFFEEAEEGREFGDCAVETVTNVSQETKRLAIVCKKEEQSVPVEDSGS